MLDYAASPVLQEPPTDPIDSDASAVDVVADQVEAPLDSKTTASTEHSEVVSEQADQEGEVPEAATPLQDSARPPDRPQA